MRNLLIIFTALIFISCSSPNTGEEGVLRTPQAVSNDLGRNLVGVWNSPCQPSLGQFSQQRVEFNSDGTGRLQNKFFNSSTCQERFEREDSEKPFLFAVLTQADPASGQVRLQYEIDGRDYDVKFENGQTLLTHDGVTLRLTKIQ